MTVELSGIKQHIHDYLAETAGLDVEITDTTDIVGEGLIDSFGLVELISFLEGKLEVTLPEGALMPEDFESPQTLTERLNDIL